MFTVNTHSVLRALPKPTAKFVIEVPKGAVVNSSLHVNFNGWAKVIYGFSSGYLPISSLTPKHIVESPVVFIDDAECADSISPKLDYQLRDFQCHEGYSGFDSCELYVDLKSSTNCSIDVAVNTVCAADIIYKESAYGEYAMDSVDSVFESIKSNVVGVGDISMLIHWQAEPGRHASSVRVENFYCEHTTLTD